jgi:LPXTG-site transpeptidase (sortase) family protein
MARFGTALLVLGLLALGYGALWQLGVVPGSRVTLPPPVALERAAPGAREVALAAATALPLAPAATVTPVRPVATLEPLVLPRRVPTPAPTAVPKPLVAADAADRDQLPSGRGYAVRLTIPAIKLDTKVEQAGIVQDQQGQPAWQTLPFVAVHYGDLTSLIGARGNAVIAGHVVTLSEGNVFRFLYKLNIDDQVNVWDQHDKEHDFHVVDVKLVPPDDISAMAPTSDETLTLITCGGTFDPVKREFSDRLIVTAKPVQAQQPID